MELVAVLLLAFTTGGVPTNQALGADGSCQASTTVRTTGPSEPGVSSVGPGPWYINADRSIWVAVPEAGWVAGGKLYSGGVEVPGQKTYWVRPAGSQLQIAARRLDASAPAAEAHIPCCYPTGFQIVSLFFPTDGCWEVRAWAGRKELRFITKVRREFAH